MRSPWLIISLINALWLPALPVYQLNFINDGITNDWLFFTILHIKICKTKNKLHLQSTIHYMHCVCKRLYLYIFSVIICICKTIKCKILFLCFWSCFEILALQIAFCFTDLNYLWCKHCSLKIVFLQP